MKQETFKNQPVLIAFMLLASIFVLYGIYLDYSGLQTHSFNQYLKVTCSAIASLSGLLFLYLEIKERYSMFYIGLIYSGFSIAYLYFWSPLLWDLTIQIVYLVLTVYGLYYWKNPDKNQQDSHHEIVTRRLSCKELFFYTVVMLLLIATFSFIGVHIGRYESLLQNITDATTTASAIIGQWFLSKKILETWHLWIIVNALSVPLYISIDSYAYAFLYASFIPLTLYGLWSWRKYLP